MTIPILLKPKERIQFEFAPSANLEKAFVSINISHLRRDTEATLQRVNSDLQINSTDLRSAMLRAARAKALATQDWTALLGLEWNGVRLAALIANDFEPLALAASTAA
jgi:hypothetical protein